MATKYTFYFSDTAKSSFDLHAYTANGPISPSNGTLIPQAVAQTTTLKLYGKGMKNYGEGVEQNLIYILENFANSIEPVNAIEGQQWYKNSTSELFINNGSTWDGIILSNGVTSMSAELILSGNAVSTLGAVPKQQLDTHTIDFSLHMTTEQNAFFDGLDLVGSPGGTITASDVNQLQGIGGNVQIQINDKISRTGDTMDASADFTLNGGDINMIASGNIIFTGGKITGLPISPTISTEATSKQYVDAQLASGIGGDGVLTSIDFVVDPGGSPPPIYDTSKTTLEFTISFPGSPSSTVLSIDGIARAGHFHSAIDVIFDNTFNGSYPVDVQNSIEYIDTNKADLLNPIFTSDITANGDLIVNSDGTFIGQVTASDPTVGTHLATKNYVDNNVTAGSISTTVGRKLELTPGGSPPVPYNVLSHLANDNKMSITINGIKYYGHTYGVQQIQYDESHQGDILGETLTGLDQSVDYEFNIAIDGGSAVTVTIPTGTDTTSHTALFSSINTAMAVGSPPLAEATISLEGFISNTEVFTSHSSGVGSSIVISDPGGSPDVYLFAIDASPTNILSAVFRSEPIGGSPGPTPDEIEITGDVTASFPIGKSFTIRGSNDATYGSFDGVYRVHNNGAVYSASPGTTLIPIATVFDSSVASHLLPSYQPAGAGSPAPAAPSPSAYGAVHFTPIGRFDQVLTAIDGINGDYAETDSAGNTIKPGTSTDYILFSTTIPSGEKIETILIN